MKTIKSVIILLAFVVINAFSFNAFASGYQHNQQQYNHSSNYQRPSFNYDQQYHQEGNRNYRNERHEYNNDNRRNYSDRSYNQERREYQREYRNMDTYRNRGEYRNEYQPAQYYQQPQRGNVSYDDGYNRISYDYQN